MIAIDLMTFLIKNIRLVSHATTSCSSRCLSANHLRKIKTKFNFKFSFGFFFFFLFFAGAFFSLTFNNRTCVVKNVVPQTLSPPGSTPWKQQGPPSPSSASSDSSPAYSPSRTLDLSGSSTSFSSDRIKMSTHQWKSGPVEQWNNEQVCITFNTS